MSYATILNLKLNRHHAANEYGSKDEIQWQF